MQQYAQTAHIDTILLNASAQTSSSHSGEICLQVLGHGLQGLPRDQIILATKVGRYDKAKFDFSAKTVTQSVHDSLKRLQVDYIDLIQTHDIEFGDLDQVCCLPAVYMCPAGNLKHLVRTACRQA